MAKRLLLIGVDAGDAKRIRAWADEGYLPTFARLLRTGAVVNVRTPPGLVEGAVWPSLITGASPGRHGMMAYDQLRPGSYELAPALRSDRLRVSPFWMALSRAGRRVVTIDVPFTRPLRRVNGIQVVNWGAHDGWSWPRSSSPGGLMTELLARFGEHPVPVCDNKTPSPTTLDQYAGLRAGLVAGATRRAALIEYCLGRDQWDFAFAVFGEAHCAGHQFWHFMEPGHPRHDAAAPRELRTAVRDVYAAIDAGVGRLLERVPAGTQVGIVCSHGMGPYYTGSHLLDELLARWDTSRRERGRGTRGPDAATAARRDAESREWPWRVGRKLLGPARRAVKALLPARAQAALWGWTHPDPNPWPHMQAFRVPGSEMSAAIRVNVRGRDPSGMVAPGQEFEEICRELITMFTEVEDPVTGRRLVRGVARASEMFRGPRMDEVPDLFVDWEQTAPISALRSPTYGTVTGANRGHRTGSHVEGGLLIGLGPDFGTGEIHCGASTEDIAPTVLDFFGVASPAHCDGRSVLPALSGRSGGAPVVSVASRPAPLGA